MVNDWKTVGLGEISEFSQGLQVDPKDQFYEYEEGMVRFIRIIDFTNPSEPVRFINCTNDRYMVNENDIVMIRYGSQTAGKVVKGMQGVIANNMFKINILSNEVERSYLYHFLSNRQVFDLLRSSQSSSTMPAITFGLMKSLEISYPPIPEQKAIAHILGTLDEKIELNRQMNETLEAMAQALFKSWFVDFDPVIDNALLAGNDIPEPLKERAELRQAQLNSGKAKANSNINDLFPSEFEFTEELGWIPKGWKVQLSNTLFDIRDGTHDSPKQVEEGKYLITSRHITTGVIDFDNAYFISQEDFEEVNRRSAVAPYDILITMIGTVGISHLVLQEEIDFAIKNVGLFRTGEDRRIAIFFYLYLKSKFMEHYLESRMAGTTQKYLTLKALRSLPVTKPSNELLTKFYEITSSYFNKIHANNQQVEALAKLRDTLLPKLMSGELRIPDTEKLAENI